MHCLQLLLSVCFATTVDSCEGRLFLYRLGVSSSLVGGALGGVVCLLVAVLLCGFGTGMVVVYQLRRRKEKKQSGQTPCHKAFNYSL